MAPLPPAAHTRDASLSKEQFASHGASSSVAKCPFSSVIDASLDSVCAKCPAFKHGCPFVGKDEADIKRVLSEIPLNHKACPALKPSTLTLINSEQGSHWLNFIKSVRLDFFARYEEILLASELRKGTSEAHRMAHNLKFVQLFLKEKISSLAYEKLLEQLYFLYAKLEELLVLHRDEPAVEAIYFPEELFRASHILEDLRYLRKRNASKEYSSDEDLIKDLNMTYSTSFYVKRLTYLSQYHPSLLLSHAYTRYLGDLSGGQILKKKAKRMFQLNDCEGTNYFEFACIPDESAFKDMLRTRMNALCVDERTNGRWREERVRGKEMVKEKEEGAGAGQDIGRTATNGPSYLLETFVEDIVWESNLAFKLVMDIYKELDDYLQTTPEAPAEPEQPLTRKETSKSEASEDASSPIVLLLFRSALLMIFVALYLMFREDIRDGFFSFWGA